MQASNYYVYLLQCADNTLYCGYTTDVAKRLKAHNGEIHSVGAKYTRGRRPVVLVYQESLPTKGAAMSREAQIKKMPTSKKRQLISGSPHETA